VNWTQDKISVEVTKMARAEAAAPVASGALDWRELMVWGSFGIAAVLVVGMALVGDFIPPVLVFAALFVIGGVLARREGRAGPIMLAILSVLFLGLNAPFIVPALSVPASTVDFLMTTISVTLAIVVLVAAVARLRRSPSSELPKRLAVAAVLVIVATAVLSVVARAGYDSAVAQAGDIELVTQDIEFADDSLSADAGTISVFVDNKDSTYHTFTIEELGVDVTIPGGQSARATFDADPGTYTFICVPHEGLMDGKLTVE
jgi:plastocyanin